MLDFSVFLQNARGQQKQQKVICELIKHAWYRPFALPEVLHLFRLASTHEYTAAEQLSLYL